MNPFPSSRGYNKQQAIRSWLVGERLLEQARRLGVESAISLKFPATSEELEDREAAVQQTAIALSRFTGIAASSLECLIGEVEQTAFTGRRILRKWQY